MWGSRRGGAKGQLLQKVMQPVPILFRHIGEFEAKRGAARPANDGLLHMKGRGIRWKRNVERHDTLDGERNRGLNTAPARGQRGDSPLAGQMVSGKGPSELHVEPSDFPLVCHGRALVAVVLCRD